MVNMKNENADWKSELPDGWNIYPLKYFFSFGKGLSIGKKDLIETGAPVISYGQVHSKTNSGVHSSEDLIRYVDESYYECGMNSFATSGDFIFADTSEDLEGCGNEAYVDYDKGLFAGYHTILLKAKNNEDNRYFGYLFQTDDFRYQIRSYVTRVKVYSISQVLLKRAAVIVPPYAKRIEIADYLDIKCTKIDSAISLAKSQIDALKRYKTSVITQAVTKGLDPNAEMKDSGNLFIGAVPSKWDVKKMKHSVNIVRGGSPRPIAQFITDDPTGYNWIKIGDATGNGKVITSTKQKIKESGLSKTRLVKPGTLLLTNSMSFGHPYILGIEGCIHDGWLAFYDYKGISKEYLYYYLEADTTMKQFTTTVYSDSKNG